MDLKKLKEPFPASDVEFRLAQCGKGRDGKTWAMCLAYITARAIMERLDDVCGPENWKVSYEIHGTGIMALLSIKCGDDWVTKQDGAEQTDVESFKGGISSALKRAGSAWGIGRYLYQLESGFAQIVDKGTDGALWGKTKENEQFYWLPPTLPDWALPESERGKQKATHSTAPGEQAQPQVTPRPSGRPSIVKPVNDGGRSALGAEIMKAAKVINCDASELGEWCQGRYGKTMTELTLDDMRDFLETLKAEVRA